MGLLFCSLSTLEVPEFLNLTNDTSNDYSLVSTQENPIVVVENQVSSRTEGGAIQVNVRRDPPIEQISWRGFVKSGDDLLHSFCILRT